MDPCSSLSLHPLRPWERPGGFEGEPAGRWVPDPVDAALRKRFEEAEDLRFSCDLNTATIVWWERNLGCFDLYPRELGEWLVRELPFLTTFDVTLIDPGPGHVRIGMEGFDGEGRRVVKAGRAIEFDLKQVHLNKPEIARAHRNKLYGRLMLRNAYSLALALRFEKLALTAIDYGSYVWAQAGFYPTMRAWQATANGRLRDALLGYIEQLPEKDVDWQRKADIYEVVQSDDLRAIWAIAGLHGTVDSRLEPGERVKLGWALLLESGATWEGELPFKADRIAERRLLAYPRKLTRAAAS